MDEGQNTAVQPTIEVQADQQVADIKTDATPVETPVVEKIESDDYEGFVKDFEKKEQEPAKEVIEDKILLNDKEYTKTELAELIKVNQEEAKPQAREVQLIEKDYSSLQQNKVKDFASLFDRYIRNANAPMVDMLNETTQVMEKVPNYEIVKKLAIDGFSTGDYSGFTQYLNSSDVYNFLNDIGQINQNYTTKEQPLAGEYQESLNLHHSSQWDGFITENAKDEQEKYVLNKFKEKYIDKFEESEQKDFLKIFRDARALGVNKEILDQQTNDVKQAMMNSSVNTTQKVNKQNPTTAEGIEKMNYADFNKLDEEGYFKKMLFNG